MRDSHESGLYADWVASYLQPATQNALRVEMQKARAPSDVEGYIYAFEILGTAPILSVRLLHPAYLIESAGARIPRAQTLPTRRRYV
jgi:hypothetical protein